MAFSRFIEKERRSIDEVIDHFNYTLDELQNCKIIVDTKIALEISIKYKISVYDAHFISLAIDHNILLLTGDKEILKNCSNLSLSLHDYISRM